MLWRLICMILLSLTLQPAKAASSQSFDLSDWDIALHPTLDLSGSCSLYWQKLLKPSALPRHQPDGEIAFPGTWNRLSHDMISLSSQSFATYHCRVLLPPGLEHPLSIRIPPLPSAYRLYINGEKALEFGKVGRSRRSEVPGLGSRYVTFFPSSSEISLVLQISSFHHRDGGVWWPLEIGIADAIAENRAIRVGLDAFALSCLLIMAFYHFGLYGMRRSQSSTLYFALFTSTIALRSLSAGNSDIYLWAMPWITFEIQKFFEYSSFYLSVPFFYVFLYKVFPNDFSRYYAIGLTVIGIIYTIMNLVLPTHIYTSMIEGFQIVAVATAMMTIFGLTKALRGKREGALYLMFGVIFIIIGGVNDILVAQRLSPISTQIFPYMVFFLILFQSLLLAQRFSQAFHDLEEGDKQIQKLNDDLKRQNEYLDAQVEEKTRDIRSIIEHLPQAIFTIVDTRGSLGAEVSPYLTRIFALESKTSVTLSDLLRRTTLTTDAQSQILSVIALILHEESIAFELNEGLLPRELELVTGDRRNILDCQFSPMMADDRIDKILVSIRDVTKIRQLEAESLRDRRDLEDISEILQIPAEKFPGLMGSIARFLKDSEQDLKPGLTKLSPPMIRIMRNIHTVKGIARSFGLSRIAVEAHEFETLLLEDQSDYEAQLRSFRGIKEQLQRYHNLNHHKLGRDVRNEDLVALDRQRVLAGLKSCLTTHESSLPELFYYLLAHVRTPLSRVIEATLASLPVLARKLGKSPPRVVIQEGGFSIKREIHDLLQQVMTHILRNSLDHGIEPPEERRKEGKLLEPQILIQLQTQGDFVVISIQDDGRGLDLKRIRQKAKERGLLNPGEFPPPEPLADLIFHPGFSTRDEASDVSGRGVGMDAVRAFIEQADGQVALRLHAPFKGEQYPFTIELSLPSRHFEDLGVGLSDDAQQAS